MEYTKYEHQKLNVKLYLQTISIKLNERRKINRNLNFVNIDLETLFFFKSSNTF